MKMNFSGLQVYNFILIISEERRQLAESFTFWSSVGAFHRLRRPSVLQERWVFLEKAENLLTLGETLGTLAMTLSIVYVVQSKTLTNLNSVSKSFQFTVTPHRIQDIQERLGHCLHIYSCLSSACESTSECGEGMRKQVLLVRPSGSIVGSDMLKQSFIFYA